MPTAPLHRVLSSLLTATSHDEEGQRNIPGFTSNLQVAAWKKIIDSVHAEGSVYFQQLFALGRASTVDYVVERGRPYRSSSDVRCQALKYLRSQ
jgi:NADPH2 dehydrogenase